MHGVYSYLEEKTADAVDSLAISNVSGRPCAQVASHPIFFQFTVADKHPISIKGLDTLIHSIPHMGKDKGDFYVFVMPANLAAGFVMQPYEGVDDTKREDSEHGKMLHQMILPVDMVRLEQTWLKVGKPINYSTRLTALDYVDDDPSVLSRINGDYRGTIDNLAEEKEDVGVAG